MADDREPARPEHGRILVWVMAILIIGFLFVAMWGSRRGAGAATSPAPVRSDQPKK